VRLAGERSMGGMVILPLGDVGSSGDSKVGQSAKAKTMVSMER
jgi:hypothetical protein